MSLRPRNRDRIANILVKRLNVDKTRCLQDIEYVAKGVYTKIYRYKDSAFKINIIDGVFASNNKDTTDYVDDNTLREIVGYIGIAPHPNIVRAIDIHFDSQGIIMELENMDSDLVNDDILLHLNSKTFVFMLNSLLDAIEHLHSYGLVHGDIKPHNILVKNVGTSKFRVALCDLNLVQYAPYNGIDKTYQVHGSPHYIPEASGEYRSISIDIFMIAAAFVDIILQLEGKKLITLKLLVDSKDSVIHKIGERNYQILCLMLERHPSRPYVQHIRSYLTNKICMPFEIYSTQGRDLKLDDEHLLPSHHRFDVHALSAYMTNGYCTPRYLFLECLSYHHSNIYRTMCSVFPVIESAFIDQKLKSKLSMDDNINKSDKFRKELPDSGVDLYTLNSLDCVAAQIQRIGIKKSVAMYLSQSLILFPDSANLEDFLDSSSSGSIHVFNSQIMRFIRKLGKTNELNLPITICLAPSIDQHITNTDIYEKDRYFQSSDDEDENEDNGESDESDDTSDSDE